MTPFKWFMVSIVAIMFVLILLYDSSVQNIATRTTAEVDVLSDTVGAGLIRASLNEDGALEEGTTYLDKDEVVANLVADIVAAQKNLNYDVKFDYVFVDDSGSVTTDDKKIRGIQFRVQYVNDKGTIKGTAERHLTLNQLK
ncbi:hypothetical protein H7992_05005 [Sporosarcina sp. resist]|uniref:hypothetical protein n=1 Tax=Sporosarcina sp. resist TaxID=2762563 RepID=UPI00164CEA87|nr:hypothetical protein [Sporosarcina sp. resist]QNK89087.1 hypothetical protein H7992_05005 [Sporosarcina sp. resist]